MSNGEVGLLVSEWWQKCVGLCHVHPLFSFSPLPCSGSYLVVHTIFKSRLLKDLLGEKVQWNGFVQGNTVPWEYLLLFHHRMKFLIFQPQSSHIIRHSAEQRREGDKFWLLFWVRIWLPMLLHSQVLTISIKSIFSPPSLYQGRKKTPELLLDALLRYSKTTVQQMNFLWCEWECCFLHISSLSCCSCAGVLHVLFTCEIDAGLPDSHNTCNTSFVNES